MLHQELEKRNIPDIFQFSNKDKVITKQQWPARRKEMQDILCNDEYGFFPPKPINMTAKVLNTDERFCAGKVILSKVLLTVELPQGSYSFPIYCAIPREGRPCPAFIHINFRDCVPDQYMPTEEIGDNGFAVISFCYNDVTMDNDDFTNGLAGVLYKGKERSAASPGKIVLWSWAAMRVLDYLQTVDSIDKNNISVVGHSRLGKTALLTGAFDERFAFVISNDSGCSGAAVARGKAGENVKNICGQFPFWFCDNYRKYMDKEYEMPFDQHFLLALAVPRKLYVASADEDAWADPKSEYLSCVAASAAYKFLGKAGFVCPERFPNTGEIFHDGSIGYHLRKGCHYFGRYDWQRYMEFITKHKN